MLDNLSHTGQRIVISLIIVTLLVGIISFSQLPFMRPVIALFVASIVGTSLWEYYQIAKAKGMQPLVSLGVTAALIYVFSIYAAIEHPALVYLPKIILAISFLLLFLYFFITEREPLVNLAITIFGLAYLALPLGLILKINYFFPTESSQHGQAWLYYLLFVTKITDTGGFFVGKYMGKHKLAEQISPKKTVEGAIGGLIFALVISILFPPLMNVLNGQTVIDMTLGQSIFLGIGIGVLGQIGDLGESLLKRDAGVKDSNQLPGLGGILDMVDSLVFTTPLVYFFMQLQFG